MSDLMQHSEARVATAMAARYLGQMCKHFAHRLPVEQEGIPGRITFPEAGICRLGAEDDALVLRAEAPDEAALAQVQDVVARHLVRFAFRETLAIEWHRAPA